LGRDRTPWRDSNVDRVRASEVLLRAREQQRRATAVHEAGHFLVGAYLGLLYDSIGIEVGTRIKMGVVVRDGDHQLSRSAFAAVLAAGGLAQARIGAPITLGTGSDEQQIADLRLSATTVTKARQSAAKIVDLVWPDVLLLADVVVEHNVLAGETALAYVLAAADSGVDGPWNDQTMTQSYTTMVKARASRS
jgi:hypothetical protein